MMPLDALEKAQIKEQLEATLNETCTIKQRTKVNAGTGPTTTESERATGVACRRASEFKAEEGAVAGQTRSQEWITLTLLVDQEIEATDRVVFDSDGRTYEAVRLLSTSHQFACRRVLCRAV
jgi:hypothetical protein